MEKLKYIMFSVMGREFPIVFPAVLIHNKVAHRMMGAAPMGEEVEIISAGFVEQSKDGKWTAYGRSESLSLDSRPNDGTIIEEFFRKGL